MKEKIKKFIKENKGLFVCILLVGMFVFGLCYAGARALRERGELSASADSYSSMDYDTANYFNPFTSRYSGQGFVESSTVHSVTVGGSIQGTYRSCNFLLDGFDIGDTITISAKWANTGSNIGAIRVMYTETNGVAPLVLAGGSTSGMYYTATVVASPTSTAKLCLSLYHNYNSSDYTDMRSIEYSNIMVSRNGKYSYIPHLDALAQTEYNKGALASTAGVFNDCVVDIEPIYTGSIVCPNVRFTPLLVYGGVSLKPAYAEYSKMDVSNVSRYDCDLLFSTPVYSRDLKIVVRGREYGAYFDVLTDTGDRYRAQFRYDSAQNAYGLYIECSSSDFYVVAFENYVVHSVTDFETLVFYDNGGGYRVGYTDGYKDGSIVAETEKYKEYKDGYDVGYKEGEKIGYDLGFAKGESNDPYDLGDFIFSIIDAPFRVIRDSLNFEILGVDISSLVFFILTVLVIVFVVKKVKGG